MLFQTKFSANLDDLRYNVSKKVSNQVKRQRYSITFGDKEGMNNRHICYKLFLNLLT